MANPKNNQQHTGASTPKPQSVAPTRQQAKPVARSAKEQQQTAGAASPKRSWLYSQHTWFIAGIVATVWLFFSACLQNKFTNWDDPGYIRDNHIIKDLSGEGLTNIFTTSIMGNYHPLTILTYALEYSHARLDPWLYHLDSLLFHILTTIAVYVFVTMLTKRPIAGAICGLLFGLHPMHVESVAWLAGRKDVVYGLFFMVSLIFYVLYLRNSKEKKWVWFSVAVLSFVLSILSKPVAVSLPITLFIIDFFDKRKIDKAFFIDKIPFLLIAIGAGIKSIYDQKDFGALNSLDVTFTFIERIALGGYAFCNYLWKALAPVKLSCFYPYPEKAHDVLPFEYYIYPAIALVLVAGVAILLRKNKGIMFGGLFFLVNIALLLQFIPVGGAIIAERYSYIPYMGLFFIPAWLVSGLFEKGNNKQYGYIGIGIIGIYSMFLGVRSHERCLAWYDSVSLWRDEIAEFPTTPNAYNNLGFNYFDMWNNTNDPNEKKIYYDSSYYLLSRAIELQPKFVNPYVSLGELKRSIGKFDEARTLYYKAMSLDAKEPNLYLGLAIIYSIGQRFDSAAYCFKTALKYKSNFPEAHGNYGNFLDMTGKPDEAIVEYGIAIKQNPDSYAFYLNRGRAYMNRKQNYAAAMNDFNAALEVSPDNGETYYARSYCYFLKGNKQLAIQDLNKAISLRFTQIDPKYVETLKQ